MRLKAFSALLLSIFFQFCIAFDPTRESVLKIMGVTDKTPGDSASCSKITLETFREIFRDIEPEVEINGFEVWH